jgi:hypothetical protein
MSAAVDAVTAELQMLYSADHGSVSTISLRLLAFIPFIEQTGGLLRALLAVLEHYPHTPIPELKSWQVTQSGLLPDPEWLIRHQVNFESSPAEPATTGDTSTVPPTGSAMRSDRVRRLRSKEASRVEDLIDATRVLLTPVRDVVQDEIRAASREHAANCHDDWDMALLTAPIRERARGTDTARKKLRSQCETQMTDEAWRKLVKQTE